jgi:hypothetical protein
MFWLRGWQLPEALEKLTSVRSCSPRIEAIRAATADLLTDSKALDVTIGLRRRGTASRVQVAGLDVGWHTLLDLQENPVTHRLEVTRQLLPGSYPFKFILDGTWCANFDYPTYQVGTGTSHNSTVLLSSVSTVLCDGCCWVLCETASLACRECFAQQVAASSKKGKLLGQVSSLVYDCLHF